MMAHRYKSPLPEHVLTITRFYCPRGPVRVRVASNKAPVRTPTVRQIVASLTSKYEPDSCSYRINSGTLSPRTRSPNCARRSSSGFIRSQFRAANFATETRSVNAGGLRVRKSISVKIPSIKLQVPNPAICIHPPDDSSKGNHKCRSLDRNKTCVSALNLSPKRRVRSADCVLLRSHENDSSEWSAVERNALPDVVGQVASDKSRPGTGDSDCLDNSSCGGSGDVRCDSGVPVSQVISECCSCQDAGEFDGCERSNEQAEKDEKKRSSVTDENDVDDLDKTTCKNRTNHVLLNAGPCDAARASPICRSNSIIVRHDSRPRLYKTLIAPGESMFGDLPGTGLRAGYNQESISSTGSNLNAPYQPAEYMTFTDSSNINPRMAPGVSGEELHHRPSLPDYVTEQALQERKRGGHYIRANSLHSTHLKLLTKTDRVGKQSGEPLATISYERDNDKDSVNGTHALNERVQPPQEIINKHPPLKQSYFKPSGSKGANVTLSNNAGIQPQKLHAQNSRDGHEDGVIAVGTLLATHKVSRSSSGASGPGGPLAPPHVNVAATTAAGSYCGSSSATVGVGTPDRAQNPNSGSVGNVNLRKFSLRCSQQAAQSTYYSGLNGNLMNKIRDEEPRYPDPLIGAPPSFQQRITELSALEAETIRHERSKKLKKRVKES